MISKSTHYKDLTWRQILDEGSCYLQAAGVREHELDAWYLFSEAFHMDKVHFLLDGNKKAYHGQAVFVKQAEEYGAFLNKRANRVPLQQILGIQEFMGLCFEVNQHVLIPRQDTETLVEQVLKDYPLGKESILDMCTGSGCIAISLLKLGGYAKVTGADLSREALCVAELNGKRLCREEFQQQRLSFIESDLFLNVTGQYDIIVSNPPYIPTKAIEELEPEVRDYEPMNALDGKEDGLYFYRKLAMGCKDYLKPGGSVYFEIGYDQAQAVSQLLAEGGFEKIKVVKDGSGLDRVVKAVLKMEVA